MKFEIPPLYAFALNHIRQNTNVFNKTQRKRSYLKDSGNISACNLKQIFPNILPAQF